MDSAHAPLHLHPGFASLLRGDLSVPAYGLLMLRLLGLHEPIEQRLARQDGAPWMAWRPASDDAPAAVQVADRWH